MNNYGEEVDVTGQDEQQQRVEVLSEGGEDDDDDEGDLGEMKAKFNQILANFDNEHQMLQ